MCKTVLLALSLSLGLVCSSFGAAATGQTCCTRAKAAGKECDHLCCVKARKEKKVCETCNPKKEEAKKEEPKKEEKKSDKKK